MSVQALKNMVSSMIKPIRNRLYTMIIRGVIESVKDDGGMQVVKATLLAGQTRDDIERFQNSGFTSNPLPNSECLVIAVGGNQDHLIVIADNDRTNRPKNLIPGESAQYNAFNGNKAHLKNNGNFEIEINKIKIENDTSELIDLLDRAFTALSVEPFIVNKGTFALIATETKTFKVT